MAMQLEQVVPFGRSLDEYCKMFSLTESDLQKSILSVADGPASFNAEGTKLGYQIKSIDPIYQFSATQIRDRFYQVLDHIIQQVKGSPNDWIWTYHSSPDQLSDHREQVIKLFCQDYEYGRAQGRYEFGELPSLNCHNAQYEIGLSSNFLFLYSDLFDQIFHFDSICELLRVCQEVRIFPLLTLKLQRSPHLQPVIEQLKQQGYICEIQQVEYELQRGGNQMLKIIKKAS
jgi:hypothetical protein